jgi:Fe-S-cluster containining protein
MNPIIDTYVTRRRQLRPLLDRLKILFDGMDEAYAAVADRYGFHCSGCTDNCCRTRFFHHTLVEFFYLIEGVATLPPATQESLVVAARSVNNKIDAAERRADAIRIMCPLNQEGRCILYPFRPMICRLHGIPHELHGPNGQVVKNPGCDLFFEQSREQGRTAYIRFDRTPFYRQMAMLENQMRSQSGYSGKIKLTVAQMLTTAIESIHEID